MVIEAGRQVCLSRQQIEFCAGGALPAWIWERRVKYGSYPQPEDVDSDPRFTNILNGSELVDVKSVPFYIPETAQPVVVESELLFVRSRVVEWMQIWKTHKGRLPSAADAEHSCLLPRLLSGKEALPVPPPKFASSPCYELAEGEAVRVSTRVARYADGREETVISQLPSLEWVNEDEGLLCHPPSGDLYRLKDGFLQKTKG